MSFQTAKVGFTPLGTTDTYLYPITLWSSTGSAGQDHLHVNPFASETGEPIVVDAGAGDDIISSNIWTWSGTPIIASGGEGRDTYVLQQTPSHWVPQPSTAGALGIQFLQSSEGRNTFYKITDFEAGPGGDRLDLVHALDTMPWDDPAFQGGNPMSADQGFIRLVQKGADTLVQVDRDGDAGSDFGWQTAVRLLDVQADSLSAHNFVGGFSPDGRATPGWTLDGHDKSDLLIGSTGNDQIQGGDGADTLHGSFGNDHLQGDTDGAGDDWLFGGAGRDRLFGGDGDDRLEGGAGGDRLEGGAGNDQLARREYEGNDTLIGGTGNDHLLVRGYENAPGDTTVRVQAGAGQDLIETWMGNLDWYNTWQPDHIDLSTGHPWVPFGLTTVVASGGAGTDTFRLLQAGTASRLMITDFEPGAGGDVLDLQDVLDGYGAGIFGSRYTGGDPLDERNGCLRLEQRGGDTVLLLDTDGHRGKGEAGHEIAVLQNLDAALLTADNLAGATPSSAVLEGSDSVDQLAGSLHDDTIAGHAGADELVGHAGADRLEGGDEVGDSSGDGLNGGAGNDTLLGGGGDDRLDGGRHDDLLKGGDGSDQLVIDSGNDRAFGGAGSDFFYLVSTGFVEVDGGAGADQFFLETVYGEVLATGGEGVDSYIIAHGDEDTHLTVTDFDTGAGGDRLDLNNLWRFANYDDTGSTLTWIQDDSCVRLVQSGADTWVQWDTHGSYGQTDGWTTLATLTDTRARDVDDHNFTPVQTSTSLAGGWLVRGGLGRDDLNGGVGHDVLDGLGGADTLTGGAGNDVYLVDDAGDSVQETGGTEAGGVDTVQAQRSWSLADTPSVERLRIMTSEDADATGNARHNVLFAGDGDNAIDGGGGIDGASYRYAAAGVTVNLGLSRPQDTGGSGLDTLRHIENLRGSAWADRLKGDDGDNRLSGREGSDRLTGGNGSDAFVLWSLTGSDTVTDFLSGTDQIRIRQQEFELGNGDLVLDGAVRTPGAGGFSAQAEFVVVGGSIAGDITAGSAAARIGSANGDYESGDTALFMVRNGVDSALYLFTALDDDARVEADELALLATLRGTVSTTVHDLVLGG